MLPTLEERWRKGTRVNDWDRAQSPQDEVHGLFGQQEGGVHLHPSLLLSTYYDVDSATGLISRLQFQHPQ